MCSPLVYRNTTDFGMLILYPAILPNHFLFFLILRVFFFFFFRIFFFSKKMSIPKNFKKKKQVKGILEVDELKERGGRRE